MTDITAPEAPWYERPPALEHLVCYESVPTSPPSLRFIVDLRCPKGKMFGMREHPLFPVGPANSSWRRFESPLDVVGLGFYASSEPRNVSFRIVDL